MEKATKKEEYILTQEQSSIYRIIWTVGVTQTKHYLFP